MAVATENQSERRKHPRARFQEEVTIHKVVESRSGNVFEVQGEPIRVHAKDLSEGGIQLSIRWPQSPTSLMKLNFELKKDESVDVYTKLAWSGHGACGLQFVVLDERIRGWIKEWVGRKKT